MRQFKDFAEALNELRRDLKEMGVVVHTKSVQNKSIEGDESMATYELEDYGYIVTSPHYDQIPDNQLDREWCLAEFEERISRKPLNPGDAWKIRQPYWEQFLNKQGKFDYAYPQRISLNIDRVIGALKKDPLTRRAFLPIWSQVVDIQDDFGRRVPCSLGYHFKFRQGKLNMTYLLRSSDYFEHLGNDLWLANRLQHYVAQQCDMKVGHFTHWIGSLHCFMKDVKEVF